MTGQTNSRNSHQYHAKISGPGGGQTNQHQDYNEELICCASAFMYTKYFINSVRLSCLSVTL